MSTRVPELALVSFPVMALALGNETIHRGSRCPLNEAAAVGELPYAAKWVSWITIASVKGLGTNGWLLSREIA